MYHVVDSIFKSEYNLLYGVLSLSKTCVLSFLWVEKLKNPAFGISEESARKSVLWVNIGVTIWYYLEFTLNHNHYYYIHRRTHFFLVQLWNDIVKTVRSYAPKVHTRTWLVFEKLFHYFLPVSKTIQTRSSLRIYRIEKRLVCSR